MENVRTNDMSRRSLIYALNKAMADESELPDVNVSVSHFDAGTGTMYCDNDISFNKTKIKEAELFFKSVELTLRSSGTKENIKKADYCKIAKEAIDIMLSSEYVKTQ